MIEVREENSNKISAKQYAMPQASPTLVRARAQQREQIESNGNQGIGSPRIRMYFVPKLASGMVFMFGGTACRLPTFGWVRDIDFGIKLGCGVEHLSYCGKNEGLRVGSSPCGLMSLRYRRK